MSAIPTRLISTPHISPFAVSNCYAADRTRTEINRVKYGQAEQETQTTRHSPGYPGSRPPFQKRSRRSRSRSLTPIARPSSVQKQQAARALAGRDRSQEKVLARRGAHPIHPRLPLSLTRRLGNQPAEHYTPQRFRGRSPQYSREKPIPRHVRESAPRPRAFSQASSQQGYRAHSLFDRKAGSARRQKPIYQEHKFKHGTRQKPTGGIIAPAFSEEDKKEALSLAKWIDDLYKRRHSFSLIPWPWPSTKAPTERIVAAINTLLFFHLHDDAMCLCQQACKLPLTNHRDPFAPFRIAGRLRALEAMLRVKKSDNYSQMLPDEQVDFIAYYLVPWGVTIRLSALENSFLFAIATTAVCRTVSVLNLE